METFKVGDEVRAVKGRKHYSGEFFIFKPGAVGIIAQVDDSDETYADEVLPYSVTWKSGDFAKRTPDEGSPANSWWAAADEIEAV